MRYLFLFLFTFSSSIVFPQDTLQVLTTTKIISKGSQPGLSIDIPMSTSKKVLSGWKKRFRKYKGEEIGKGIENCFRVYIPEVSKDTLWIYTIAEETDEKVILINFLSTDDSLFFNTGVSAESFSKLMRNYAIDTYKESVQERLNGEQLLLKKMDDELENLNKQSDKWYKKINENTREMERTRDQISMDKKELDIKNDAIIKQKQAVAAIQKKSEQKEVEEKKLKELEKEKKRFVNKIESANRKIDDLENENRQLERNIKKNSDENIPENSSRIVKQKDKIKLLDERLNSIH